VNVADTDAGPATTPTGVVEFSASNGPGFALRARCTLSAGSCQITFVGRANATLGQQTITCCFLPRVNGERFGEAKRAIRRWGFSVGRIDRAFSKRVHRTVALVVSRGKRHARP
jgi:hypothetical protein